MKCVIIYNPYSMKDQISSKRSFIYETLSEKFDKVSFWGTQYHNHAKELSKRAFEEGFDTIISAGGDGTLNQILNGLKGIDNKPSIGILPLGTVNDVANSLNIPKKNINKSVKLILKGTSIKHDLIHINDNIGVYSSAMGIFTGCTYSTKQSLKKKFGWFAYASKGFFEFFKKNKLDIELTINNEKIVKKPAFYAVLNSRSIAGFKINKDAELNDGQADLIVVENSKIPLIKNLIVLYRMARVFLSNDTNKLKGKNHISIQKFKSLNIKNKSLSNLNVDGEFAGNKETINYTIGNESVSIHAD